MTEAKSKKVILVRFYKSGNGSEPVKNWLKGLPKTKANTR